MLHLLDRAILHDKKFCLSLRRFFLVPERRRRSLRGREEDKRGGEKSKSKSRARELSKVCFEPNKNTANLLNCKWLSCVAGREPVSLNMANMHKNFDLRLRTRGSLFMQGESGCRSNVPSASSILDANCLVIRYRAESLPLKQTMRSSIVMASGLCYDDEHGSLMTPFDCLFCWV